MLTNPDIETDTRAGRIVEAVLIAALTAAATQAIEWVGEKLRRRKRRKRAKRAPGP